MTERAGKDEQTMSDDEQDWLTIHELSVRWRASYDTIWRDVKAGKIPSLTVGRMHRISIKAIEKMESAAITESVREVKRVAAYVASGKDHFPDC